MRVYPKLWDRGHKDVEQEERSKRVSPMQTMKVPSRSVLWWSGVVFIFFFSLILLIHTAGTAFSTPDDAYYHLRHALSYASGEPMKVPVFSTLQGPNDDLYVWYHRALAPFTRVFGDDAPAAIMGSKVFHALGAALVFVIFFVVLAGYLAESSDSWIRGARIPIALVGCAALFSLSPIFFFRLLLLRPHVFVAGIMFLVFVALERRRWLPIFLLATLLPFFYSAPFLILLPVGLYTLSQLLYGRTPRLSSSLCAPALAALLGITLGTLLRAAPLRYFFNSTVVILMSIVNRFRDVAPQGGELYAPRLLPAEIGWIAPLGSVALCFLVWAIVRSARVRPWQEEISFREFYFLLSATVLASITIFISRAAEYAVPVVFLALFWIGAERVRPAMRTFREYLKNHIKPGTPSLAAAGKFIFEHFDAYRRSIFRSAGVLLLCFMVVTALTGYLMVSSRSGEELRYRGAALYVSEHSPPGALVFNPDYSEYPRLVFWNTHNTYAMGMDPTFTYFFDRSLYWALYHSGSGGPICPRSLCSAEDADVRSLYDFLARDIGASFAFVDSAVPSFDRRYLQFLEGDSRFELVFEDPEFEEVKVFRILLDPTP